MSMLTSGLQWEAQNTKIPVIGSLVFSYRALLTAANTTQSLLLPANASNPAVIQASQNATNYSITSSPTLPNAEPQQGKRLFVTHIVVRDANAALTGTGATTPASVALYDANYNSSGVYTPTTSNNAFAAGNTVGTVNTVAAVNSPYINQSISTGLLVINPYDQLGIQFTAQVAGTASTATAFTVDVFGFFQQAI